MRMRNRVKFSGLTEKWSRNTCTSTDPLKIDLFLAELEKLSAYTDWQKACSLLATYNHVR
jgi:hypothetical protein